ncbi:MAG: sigma 54-interacting transcriptional regulator [Clostridia bacterium]|nr:sigma 54-interacting transcriptional regulator [Clostridia bacterium]
MKLSLIIKPIKSIIQELNLEVELFDASFQTVLGARIDKGACQIVKSVSETSNKFLLIQRGKHYLCTGCGQECPILSGIFVPLNLQNLSVFAVLAFTRKQQDTLLNNQDCFINITEALANLVKNMETHYHPLPKKGPAPEIDKTPCGFESIIGKEPVLETLKESVKKLARSSSTVLITGESGTGKELFARAIHNCGPRSRFPFITVNCGAIPEPLLESELFGYAPGSFTGASPSGKKGKFEVANGGTIFLDEIGDMPYSLQQKLLRVLETKRVDPIGGISSRDLDVRVIAATNQNLRDFIKQGRFRQDLYYRLNVLSLRVPPLRMRKRDISLLTEHFLQVFVNELDSPMKGISPDIREIFLQYKWPGNIRELKNIIEYAVHLGEGTSLELEHLPIWFWEHLLEDKSFDFSRLPVNKMSEDTFLQLFQSPENTSILKGLSLNEKKKLADKLGVSIATLYRRLKID